MARYPSAIASRCCQSDSFGRALLEPHVTIHETNVSEVLFCIQKSQSHLGIRAQYYLTHNTQTSFESFLPFRLSVPSILTRSNSIAAVITISSIQQKSKTKLCFRRKRLKRLPCCCSKESIFQFPKHRACKLSCFPNTKGVKKKEITLQHVESYRAVCLAPCCRFYSSSEHRSSLVLINQSHA